MNNISPQLLAQFYGQNSDDPLLMLVTISHPSFTTIRLVNNTEDIVSRSNTYLSFPMNITPPADDGETVREVSIEFDNVSLELITEFRQITSPADIKIEIVLASDPDQVQLSYEELKLRNISYDKQRIRAKLYMDSFLNVELTSESYGATNFPGLF